MDKNKIYCQVCKTHNLEFHCQKCVNKTFNLYKSEIHQYDLNMKKIVDVIKKLEKTNKPVNTIKNNLENKISEYELQIQEKKLLIQKKQEEINEKKKEIELRRQNLLNLNEKFKIKQDEYLQKNNLSNNNENKNETNNSDEKLVKDTNNNNSNNVSGDNNQEIEKKETFDYSFFLNSDNMKKLINTTYIKSYEYLNNKLMCARQILIEELSNIFKLKKITGFPHSGSHSSNSFTANNIPPGSNKSSFLNNSISQVLHDTTSKIFGAFETEVELNNNIYNNPNFNLYEDISYADSDHQKQKQMKPSQKSIPPRVKNSYLYNRNYINLGNYKYDDKKNQNISNTYTILGHTFPPINEIWNYSHEYINTTLEYIIQYVILLSYYLDIKLPFSLHYQGIRSYVECHLYNCTCYLPLCYSEKTIEEFLTGLSMLCYDIVYLCHTQGVFVEEKNVLNILKNIYKCSKSPFLGQTLNIDLQLHHHNINFSKLPISKKYTSKEIFNRRMNYTVLNNTLGNSFNLRFSEIVKLVFLYANIQIPISNTTIGSNSNNPSTPIPDTTIPNVNTDTNNIKKDSKKYSSSNRNSFDATKYQKSSIEWNDIDINVETMTLSDDDIIYNQEMERRSSKDKNAELLNNANKKLKSLLSINNIIHTDKKGSNGSINNNSDSNDNQNGTYSNVNYLYNTNGANDESFLEDPSKSNNIFDYENMMGPEEQIRKQRLTEFLSCVFHDYFSNTNTNEWVLINQ